ncbi:MAG TPA: DNA polymerase IV, partial [Spirochaetales bacterium]|nr:DNA polymerase IV [Spirochaetales bacterium]
MQFHVDMDAFYASVEQLDRPELAGMPVIVGAAPGHRGVVSTCSYEARAFGVHSAMPISEAVRLCPGGIFLPVRMERYLELSRTVMDILGEFSPDLRQISVDEAFLDMTGTEGLWGAPRAAAT